MKKFLGLSLTLALVLVLAACGGKKNSDTLVVGYDDFSEKFSPFFASTAYDQDVVSMTSLGLMTTDRDGGIIYDAIKGETVSRGGVDHFYDGITKLEVVVSGSGISQTTTYKITLKEGVKFSDGEEMTADDIIFSYYVYLDPNYTGSTTLSSVDIVGLKNYVENNSNASAASDLAPQLVALVGLSDEDLAATGDDKVTVTVSGDDLTLEEMKTLRDFMNTKSVAAINTILTSEFGWVADDVVTDDSWSSYWRVVKDGEVVAYDADTHTAADVSAQATFAYFYANAEGYSVLDDNDAVKSKETVIAEIAAQYGNDFAALDAAYGAAVTQAIVEEDAFAKALLLIDAADGAGQPVANISGIKKVSDYKVEVTVNGFDAAAIYQVCGITVGPLHYYGDETKFDYANNKFGFNNRAENSMALIEENTATPMGAGPYKFVKFENNVVYFEANENYYRGKPKTKYIRFQVVDEANKVSGILTGDIDISNPTASKDKFAEINAESKKILPVSVDNLGYGYIGLNAMNVQVVEDTNNPEASIGSEDSRALRTAFATVFAAYRYTAIPSYYGDMGSIIEYPISNTSWAAPKAGDSGFEYAFAQDPDGKDIYNGKNPADVTNTDRMAAAKANAKAWFEEAGYTFAEKSGSAEFGGKLWTATAPTGAKTEYEIIIPAGGGGDHPAYAIGVTAKNVLAELGITLTINDPADTNVLWDAIDANSVVMWAAAWGSTIDPDMYQVYHSSNVNGDNAPDGSTGSNNYYLRSDKLDKIIMDARQSIDQDFRKTEYKKALDEIISWAVEVPTYQRQNVFAISKERVDVDSLTPDITTYWSWMAEIENLEMK